MYRSNTRLRIMKFLIKRKSCLISELCYLGKKKMQIKYPTVMLILDDLLKEKLIKIERLKFNKRKMFKIVWR